MSKHAYGACLHWNRCIELSESQQFRYCLITYFQTSWHCDPHPTTAFPSRNRNIQRWLALHPRRVANYWHGSFALVYFIWCYPLYGFVFFYRSQGYDLYTLSLLYSHHIRCRGGNSPPVSTAGHLPRSFRKGYAKGNTHNLCLKYRVRRDWSNWSAKWCRSATE
jgi:hypothetical protein